MTAVAPDHLRIEQRGIARTDQRQCGVTIDGGANESGFKVEIGAECDQRRASGEHLGVTRGHERKLIVVLGEDGAVVQVDDRVADAAGVEFRRAEQGLHIGCQFAGAGLGVSEHRVGAYENGGNIAESGNHRALCSLGGVIAASWLRYGGGIIRLATR